MWFLRTRQAGKADRHYTAPCPSEKIKAIQAMHAQTPLHQAWGSSVGVRQGRGVRGGWGRLGETRAQVLDGKTWRFLCFDTERGTSTGRIWLELRLALPVWKDKLMNTQLACQLEKPPGEGRPSLSVLVSGWLHRGTLTKHRCAFTGAQGQHE